MERGIKRVAVIGAGTMGHGIAQVCGQAGFQVMLYDVDPSMVQGALKTIEGNLEHMVAKGKIPTAAREQTLRSIQVKANLKEAVTEAVTEADLAIEAIPERMDLKLETFREIDLHAPSHAVLATNTSSLSITEIAGVTQTPGRVIGLHFFNPVPVMELLEIVIGIRTTDLTVATAQAFAKKIGKRAILVKDSPGFATSRLGVALAAEAIRMLESGVASAEDIDLAMELGYRHPMGPLRLTDLVGLDVRLMILEHLYKEVGEQFRPPILLRQMVRAGKLGRKTGEGFYKYLEEKK